LDLRVALDPTTIENVKSEHLDEVIRLLGEFTQEAHGYITGAWLDLEVAIPGSASHLVQALREWNRPATR